MYFGCNAGSVELSHLKDVLDDIEQLHMQLDTLEGHLLFLLNEAGATWDIQGEAAGGFERQTMKARAKKVPAPRRPKKKN